MPLTSLRYPDAALQATGHPILVTSAVLPVVDGGDGLFHVWTNRYLSQHVIDARVRIDSEITVANDNRNMIARAAGARLVAAYRNPTTGEARLRFSDDNGLAWSAAATPAALVGFAINLWWSDLYLDGTTLYFFFSDGLAGTAVRYITSADGATWSAATVTDLTFANLIFVGRKYRMFRSAVGTWFVMQVGNQFTVSCRRNTTGTAATGWGDDAGTRIVIAHANSINEKFVGSILERGTGTGLVACFSQGPAGSRIISHATSADDGVTWPDGGLNSDGVQDGLTPPPTPTIEDPTCLYVAAYNEEVAWGGAGNGHIWVTILFNPLNSVDVLDNSTAGLLGSIFEVNWNGDGATYVDESALFIASEFFRGRDYASALTGRSSAGQLHATLQNVAGRFSPYNSASPLSGNLVPGRRVRVRVTKPIAAPLWLGFMDEITPGPRFRGVMPTVIFRASGPLKWVAQREATTAVFTAIKTGTAVGKVLDDAGWPAADRTIDAGQVTMNRWSTDGRSALEHLRELEETEFGFLTESKDGKIVYEDVQHRLKTPHTVSQATFSDASGAALPYDSIEELDAWRDIFNRVDAEVTLYSVQVSAVLWSLVGETPLIKPGGSKDFWAKYPTPDAATQSDHVDAWTTPVATTDFIVNSAADGTGTDLTASITIAVVKTAVDMKITLTNTSATPAYLTLLQARGTPAYKNDPIKIVYEDTASQTKYGKRTFPLPGKFWPSTEVALSRCQFIVDRYKDPNPLVAIGFDSRAGTAHEMQIVSRDISDRVTIVANGTTQSGAQLGLSKDFFIERIHHMIDLRAHRVRYDLSDIDGDGSYWILSTSALGTDTKLGV